MESWWLKTPNNILHILLSDGHFLSHRSWGIFCPYSPWKHALTIASCQYQCSHTPSCISFFFQVVFLKMENLSSELFDSYHRKYLNRGCWGLLLKCENRFAFPKLHSTKNKKTKWGFGFTKEKSCHSEKKILSIRMGVSSVLGSDSCWFTSTVYPLLYFYNFNNINIKTSHAPQTVSARYGFYV